MGFSQDGAAVQHKSLTVPVVRLCVLAVTASLLLCAGSSSDLTADMRVASTAPARGLHTHGAVPRRNTQDRSLACSLRCSSSPHTCDASSLQHVARSRTARTAFPFRPPAAHRWRQDAPPPLRLRGAGDRAARGMRTAEKAGAQREQVFTPRVLEDELGTDSIMETRTHDSPVLETSLRAQRLQQLRTPDGNPLAPAIAEYFTPRDSSLQVCPYSAPHAPEPKPRDMLQPRA